MRRVTRLMDTFDDDDFVFPDEKEGEPVFKLNNVSIETPSGKSGRRN